MQSFSRLTNAQPWVPFRKVNASSPKTAVDLEEEGLFNRLHKDYKRHVSPGTPRHGYRDFELAWNIEVSERYRKKMEDESDEIVLINRKSYVQLQQHFDDIVHSERMSRICDPNCLQLQQMNRTLRQTCQVVAGPRGRVAERIEYRNAGRPTPFGAPTTLNPDITRHAIVGNYTNRQAVPWNVAAPQILKENDDVLHKFKRATWCVTCGFRKREHTKEESYSNKCKREHCSNCMQLKQHGHPNGMGPRCTNPRKESSPHVHWYN